MNEFLPTIHIHFIEDFAKILRDRLTIAGYEMNPNESPRDIIIKYLNILHRQIEVKPRIVLQSREFNCPPDHQPVVEKIRRKAESGENLNTYLSDKLLCADFCDELLLHWGIHHFHLGKKMDKSGFVKGTWELLFARITDTHVYFIDVKGHSSWSDRQLLEIQQKNWPDVMSEFRLKGIVRLQENLSDKQIYRLRNAGVNTLIQLSDGSVFGNFGFGMTMAGRNTANRNAGAMREYMHWANRLKEMEEFVKGQINKMVTEGISLPPEVHLRLELDGERVLAIDENSDIRCVLGNLNN